MSGVLTPEKVHTMASNMVEHISKQKRLVTDRTIRKLQNQGRFPKDNNYEAFLGRTVGANIRTPEGVLQVRPKSVYVQDVFNNAQRFKNPDVFHATVAKYPSYYTRPWGFRPLGLTNVEDMVKALQFAYNETQRLQARYFGPFKTGAYLASLLTIIRQPDGTSQAAASGYNVEARRLQAGSELILVNFNPWAAAIEALSVEKYRDVGIMYQAAKVTARKYKALDISFTYTNMNSKRYLNVGLPLTHNMMIPVIRISMRGGNKASQRFSKPGRNIRSGISPWSNTEQRAAKNRRAERKAARKAARRR